MLNNIKSICNAKAAANDHPAMYLNPGALFRTSSAYVKDLRSVSQNLDTVQQIVDTSILSRCMF